MKKTISILLSILACSSIATVAMPTTFAQESTPPSTSTQTVVSNSYEQISADGVLEKVTAQAPANYVISENVTKIGDSAFAGLKNIKTVTIPSSVTQIGESAFKNCSSLTSISIPDSVTYVGEKAFYKCTSLSKIKLSKNTIKILDSTFFGCKKLMHVTIPEKVTYIGYRAFIKCTSLKRVYFSKTNSQIKFMDDTAFDFRPESFRFSFNCRQNKYIAKYSKENIIYATNDSHVFKKKYTIDQKADYGRPGYKSHHCKYCNNVDKYVKLKAKKFPTTAPVVTNVKIQGGKTYVTLKKREKAYKSYEIYFRVGDKKSGYGYGGFMPANKIKGKTLIFNFECNKGDNIIIKGYGKKVKKNKIVTQKTFSMNGAHTDADSFHYIILESKPSKVFVIK